MKQDKTSAKEEVSSSFQRHRVDTLLGELIKKFPIPQIPTATVKKEEPEPTAAGDEKPNGQLENVKQEKDANWPPEKKMKFN